MIAHRRCAAGDVIWFDPDAQAEVVYNNGDLAWIIAATALVWIMIPGVGYFYSGLLRRKNALSMIFLGVAVLAVVSFQWFFWGFSLAFSETADKYIGDLGASQIYSDFHNFEGSVLTLRYFIQHTSD